MALLSTLAEIEELGNGQVRQSISIKRIADYRNGNLYRLLNRIGNTGDPNLPLGVDEAINFRVRDRLSGNAPVVHFGKGQSHVRFTPLGTNNINGIVAGNTILFPGAWNNADLKLSIGGHILRKDIALRTGHPSVFSFRIDAHQNFDLDTLSSAEFRILPPSLEGPLGQHIPLSWAKSVQGGKTVLTVMLPAGDYAGWTLDPTITLQPDATDGIDTVMLSDDPATNYGTAVFVIAGESNGEVSTRRTLIKFNLTTLPANGIISSTTLSLYATTDRSDNARTYRVYRQLRAWVESQATWNIYSTGNNWGAAGGFDATDCEQADIGSRNFTATETLNEFKDFSLTPTTKKALDLGNGWLIKADTENADSYQFSSSDAATAADRPKLVVVYKLASGMVPLLLRRIRL